MQLNLEVVWCSHCTAFIVHDHRSYLPTIVMNKQPLQTKAARTGNPLKAD